MTGFLAGLGTKLAERWVALLVLPGLIYISAAAAAVVLGHRHALDLSLLASDIVRLAAQPASSNVGVILLTATAVVAASAAAGLLASALGQALEWSWHRPEHRRLSSWLTRNRRSRWQRADQAADWHIADDVRNHSRNSTASAKLSPATIRVLAHRDAIAQEPPAGPTWIGDRFRALAVRVRRAYALDIHTVWPSLWLLLPDQPRAEITAARDGYTAAGRLGGWAILYLLLGTVSWPALLAAVLLAAIARYRARRTAQTLAELIEAAVDCHTRDLATRLGFDCEGPLTRHVGVAMTDLLNKDPETRVERPDER
jgi:hypothetical protein